MMMRFESEGDSEGDSKGETKKMNVVDKLNTTTKILNKSKRR